MTTVLVVDDALVDQRLAGGCVEELGSKAIYAENGRAAIDAIECEQPDLVLTDLQMPEMDGLALVRHLRQNRPSLPVILMTAFGSEQVAVEALKAGAASYVPKANLKADLGEALRAVQAAVESMREQERVRLYLDASEARFVFGYEPDAPQALISYLQDGLRRLSFCDETERFQVSTALSEAITNAIDHGNLELDSDLRERGDDAYRRLGEDRSREEPYKSRRVFVRARLTSTEATYWVRDEGPGFDPATLPDPLDPENLVKPHGRGIMLIRTFMDEVTFAPGGNEITMVKRREDGSDSHENTGI
jgi:CheY-like chemotaxis protein/anti-sigma regulatory factor (Ser/Thr protein kinase)